MLKKIFIGIAALGLTATALANGNSVPLTTATTTPANNFNPGIYLGIQGGYAIAGWYRINNEMLNDTGTSVMKVKDDSGIGGRVFVGYDFTKNWAAELGYMYFGSKTKLKVNDTTYGDVTTQAFDLVGKGKIPIVDKFDIYAKLGIGYLMSKGLQHFGGNTLFTKDKQNNISGVVGFGVDYYFMPNLWMDLSWTRHIVDKKGSDSSGNAYGKYQPDADLYALGIAYKFNF